MYSGIIAAHTGIDSQRSMLDRYNSDPRNTLKPGEIDEEPTSWLEDIGGGVVDVAKAAPTSIAAGIPLAGAAVESFLTEKAMQAAASVAEYFSPELAQPLYGDKTYLDILRENQARDWAKNARDFSEAMKPKNMGIAGEITWSLGTQVTPVVAIGAATGGLGAVPALAATSATGGSTLALMERQSLLAKGVDFATADAATATSAAFNTAGILLPASKAGSLAVRAVTGAGINGVTGAAQDFSVQQILENNGYDKIAKEYDFTNIVSRGTDIGLGALMGAAFGKRVKVDLPDGRQVEITADDIPPSMKKDLMQVAEQNIAEIDSSTQGIPANFEAQRQHQQMRDEAFVNLMNDEPIDVARRFKDEKAEFIDNPMQEQRIKGIDELNREMTMPNFRQVEEVLANPEKFSTEVVEQAEIARQSKVEAEGLVEYAKAEILKMPEPLFKAGEFTPKPPENTFAQTVGGLQGGLVDVDVGYLDWQQAQWTVVEADTLKPALQQDDFQQNRDRSRGASEIDLNQQAQKFDFRLASASAQTNAGAPTIAKDGTLFAGNGRAKALQDAYKLGTAGDYRNKLAAAAKDYGFDPQAIMAMKQPALVRVLLNDIDTAKAAIASNEQGGLTMSAMELAKTDADRITSFSEFDPSEDGNLAAASNKSFIRSWLGKFPVNQQAALLTSGSRGGEYNLSSNGILRLRNAILYKAFGRTALLEKLSETDEGLKNVMNGLIKVAPEIAMTRNGIEAGIMHNLDISKDLNDVALKLFDLRNKGQSVSDYLKQSDLTEGRTIDEGKMSRQDMLLSFLDKNARSGKKISDTVSTFYKKVQALGNPLEADIFGDKKIPAIDELVENVFVKGDKAIKEGEPLTMTELTLMDNPKVEVVVRGEEKPAAKEYQKVKKKDILQKKEGKKTPEALINCATRRGA